MKINGHLKFNGDTKAWEIRDIPAHVMIKIKMLFPRIPRTAVGIVSIPHNQEACCDILWFMERYKFKVTDVELNFMKAEKDSYLFKMHELEGFFVPDYKPIAYELKKPLRDYQAQYVEVFRRVKRLINGDPVGLGKTPAAIGSMLPETLPAAVVCQTHLQTQWQDFIHEFSHLKVYMVKNGPAYQLPPADVYIFKYNQLVKWIDIFTQHFFKSVHFDECQELRRLDSQKYTSAKVLADHAEYVAGYSATPIYNYGDEIWNIYNVIRPDFLGDKTSFLREWSGLFGGRIGNPQALGTYLRDNFVFIRRTREEVSRELPPLTTLVEHIDYDQAELAKVEDIATQISARVLHSPSFEERGRATRELDMLMRQATGIAKAKTGAAYIRMLVEAGEPVLVAAWHRECYRILNEELADLNPLMYTGSESPTEKDKHKKMFIDGKSDLMMISLRSGIGLDGLQARSSIVVVLELDYSPQVHEQLIGRLRRDGQLNQVTAIFLIANGGSDPGIVEILGIKASQSSGILDPFSGPAIIHSDESRIKQLARSFLEKRNQNGVQEGAGCVMHNSDGRLSDAEQSL